MQVQHSHNQCSHAQPTSKSKVNFNTSSGDEFQNTLAHTQSKSQVTYQKLGRRARVQNISTPSLNVSTTTHNTPEKNRVEQNKSESNVIEQGTSLKMNLSASEIDVNTNSLSSVSSQIDTRPEVTPQATLEKAQEIKQKILHNQDPSLHNPQLLMKAQLLERKAKAQLHKGHAIQRFVKAPRLL